MKERLMSSSNNTSVGVLSHLDDYNDVPDALDEILHDVDLDFGKKKKSKDVVTEGKKESSADKSKAEDSPKSPKLEVPNPLEPEDAQHKGEDDSADKVGNNAENGDNQDFQSAEPKQEHKKVVRHKKVKTVIPTVKTEEKTSSEKGEAMVNSDSEWDKFLSICEEERNRPRSRSFGGNAKNVPVDSDIITLFKLLPIEGNSVTTIVNSILRLFVSRYKSNILNNKNLASIQSMLEMTNQLKKG